jgi:1-acyl-sn-glycerol-3-phosphate acyltransferase
MNILKKPFIKRAAVIAAYTLVFWVILPGGLIAAAAYLDRTLCLGFPPHPAARALGIGGAAVAAVLLVLGVVQFKAYGRELPVSLFATQGVIQDGLYRIWRHPIYLFFTALFACAGLAAGSGAMLAIVLPVFAGMELVYIAFEERLLVRRFGQRYARYRKKTPLVIPGMYQTLRIPAMVLAKLFFSCEIHGRPRIPLSPPFFVVAAHRNYLDPFFLGLAFLHPISFVTTQHMFRKPLSAAVFRGMFGVPKRRYVSDIAAGREVVRRIRRDCVIGIFPEGERSWTGAPGAFKPEAIKLLRMFSGVPVVPVRIDGAYEAWPRWAFGPRRAKIRITVQEPFLTDKNEPLEEFVRRLAISLQPAAAGFSRRSRMRAAGIGRLIYRCPRCETFDALRGGGDAATCAACGLRIVVNPDCTLALEKDGRETATLDELYRRIRIAPRDLRFSGGKLPRLTAGGSTVAESGPLMISAGNAAALGRPRPGALRLTSAKLMVCRGGEEVAVPLIDITSATIEGTSRLQIYLGRCQKRYEAVFENESALKWQDYVVEAVAVFASRTINRS